MLAAPKGRFNLELSVTFKRLPAGRHAHIFLGNSCFFYTFLFKKNSSIITPYLQAPILWFIDLREEKVMENPRRIIFWLFPVVSNSFLIAQEWDRKSQTVSIYDNLQKIDRFSDSTVADAIKLILIEKF